MRFLRTNTAVIITVGPFYDKTDGVTIETGLTITNERITLTADTDAGSAPTNILDNVTGATSGTDNDLNYITGNDAGMMQIELSQANTNRLGRMFLSITDAANHVPVFHEFMVLPAMIYDAFILGTDVLDASMTQILGTAVSSPATAGILDVNVKNMNNVAGTGITTVAAYQGTTQPVNFNGTGATAYVKSDVTQIATAAVSVTTAQLGVNLVNIAGSAVNTGTAQIGANVVSQANIDFGALQKTSLNAATPASVQNIAVTGTNFTAIPWNAAWDAEVQSEVNDEIVLQNLDHLCKTTTAAADMTTEVADGTIISRILSKTSDTSTYDVTTDSLEALRDRGDAAWITATGFGTAAELAKVPKSDAAVTWNATALASINAEVDTALDTAIPGSPTADSVNERVKAIDDLTQASGSGDLAAIKTTIGAAGAGLTAVTLSTAGIDAIWDRASTLTLTFEQLLTRAYQMINNKMNVTDADGVVALRAIGDGSTIATGSVTDNSTTTTRLELTWA
jgi:hypothetical protein